MCKNCLGHPGRVAEHEGLRAELREIVFGLTLGYLVNHSVNQGETPDRLAHLFDLETGICRNLEDATALTTALGVAIDLLARYERVYPGTLKTLPPLDIEPTVFVPIYEPEDEVPLSRDLHLTARLVHALLNVGMDRVVIDRQVQAYLVGDATKEHDRNGGKASVVLSTLAVELMCMYAAKLTPDELRDIDAGVLSG